MIFDLTLLSYIIFGMASTASSISTRQWALLLDYKLQTVVLLCMTIVMQLFCIKEAVVHVQCLLSAPGLSVTYCMYYIITIL